MKTDKDKNNDVTGADVLRYSWHIWRRGARSIPILLFGMGLAAFLDTLFPVVMGRLMRVISSHQEGEAIWHGAIGMAFLMLVGLELFYHTTRNGVIYLWNRFALVTLHAVVSESFSRVQRFSTDWHANSFAGGTVRKITRGMWSFDTYEDNLFMYMYPTFIVLISTVTLMCLRWPVMGLVTLFVSLLYIGFSVWAVIKINAPNFRKSAAADTRVGATLADSITANSAVKSFGNEDHEEKTLDVVTGFWRNRSIRAWQTANVVDLGRRYLALFMMISMMGVAVLLWEKGQAVPEDIIYVFTAYMVLSAYLRHIGEQISNLMRSVSEMEDVISFWKMETDIEDHPQAKAFHPADGKIELQDVTFSYKGKDEPVYENLNLTIKPGEKIALVGHSGAGKTTFVKLLQRLYDVTGGAILIDGQDVRHVTQKSLRRAIALVPQEPVLFHRSIAVNIAYGKPEATIEEIKEAARKAYADEFIENLPLGYQTLVGERGVKLSGGERQRVAIARAILANAPILILDEATSSLDSVSEHYIQKALETLKSGRTTIIIAHRLSTIKGVDRILVFDNGRIVEQGTHADLLSNPLSHYRKLYEMQALGFSDEDEDGSPSENPHDEEEGVLH